jgi:hypothetical protein
MFLSVWAELITFPEFQLTKTKEHFTLVIQLNAIAYGFLSQAFSLLVLRMIPN